MKAAKIILARRCVRGTKFTTPNAAADYLVTHYSDKPSEVFVCLFQDNNHRLIAAEEMFHGTVDGEHVYPREIARRCLELNAPAVVLAHNHPSGISKPSNQDFSISERIGMSLDLIDVRILDHLVIGDGDVFSILEQRLLRGGDAPASCNAKVGRTRNLVT